MKIHFLLSESKSLFEELWEYITDKYFNPQTGNYSTINGGTSRLISLRIIIIGITVGICVAAILTLVDKKHLGGLVRKMLYDECIGKENAKTLYDLGYGKNPTVRGSVKNGSVLKKWVRCVEEDEYYDSLKQKEEEFYKAHEGDKKAKFVAAPFKRDPSNHHFYIDEEQKYTAAVKFESKGTNIVTAVFVILIAIILCVFLCFIIPEMLQMFDNFLTGFKKQ